MSKFIRETSFKLRNSFRRNKKYEVSKAHQLQPHESSSLSSTFTHLGQRYNHFNAHLNPAYDRSNDDQELDDVDRVASADKLDSINSSPALSPRLRAKKVRHVDDEVSFERGESIFFERKSIIPELETIIKWDNLELEITAKGKTKKILDNVSGEVNNLDIMCILGPSGAGKSTLLNTIAGRTKNYTGEVNFYSKDKRVAFAYVPQVDQLTQYLTVKESLLFSSKLKNPSNTNHIEEVEFVLSAFNLWKAKNHYTYKCSGGERKRLSIGLEMISKPKILILDEPTSGLDSTTSYIVIEVLKNINKNTAIITTIHQPNSNLFQLFDKCYILTGGKCIYNGTPSGIVDHMKGNFDCICPTFTNPADFILEVANDTKTDKGLDLIERMSAYEQEANRKKNEEMSKLKNPVKHIDANGNNQSISIMMNNHKDHDNRNVVYKSDGSKTFVDPISGKRVDLQEIARSSFKRKNHFFREFWQNFKKLIICSVRDPQQTIFRLMNSVVFPIVLHITVTGEQARETGCTFLPANETHILNENMYERYDRQMKGIQAGITFVNSMFVFFSAMVPAILVLSQHINVLRKEYMNSYYTIHSFFCAIISVNLLLGFFYSTANAFSYFFFTGQVYETEKFLMFWFIIFLGSMLGDLFGLELSILYPEQNLTAVVMGGFGGFALHTLSGFFVPIDTMRLYIQSLSFFVFCRHIFEASMRTFYGHGKCKIADAMIFDFDNLIDFIKYYNYENDGALEDVEDMPLKVRNALREKVWNRSSIMEMAETMNDLGDAEINRLNDFWDTKTSYIIDSFNLQDSQMASNLIIILITILCLVLLCFVTLSLKLKK